MFSKWHRIIEKWLKVMMIIITITLNSLKWQNNICHIQLWVIRFLETLLCYNSKFCHTRWLLQILIKQYLRFLLQVQPLFPFFSIRQVQPPVHWDSLHCIHQLQYLCSLKNAQKRCYVGIFKDRLSDMPGISNKVT